MTFCGSALASCVVCDRSSSVADAPAPLALMLPWKSVWPSAQTITLPPLPETVASAEMLAPLCTSVCKALGTSAFLPWKSPPTNTVPPPVAPEASTLEPSRSSTRAPVICTRPPWPPAALALIEPLLTVVPLPPDRRMLPPGPASRPIASIRPWLLMASEVKAPAASAVSSTVPPSARIAPPFTIRASTAAASTSMLTGPPMFRRTREPAAISASPRGVSIRPRFSILAAISATKPPSLARRLPWFTTPAAEVPLKR